MHAILTRRAVLTSGLAAGLFSLMTLSAAYAHHGWAWTENGFFELKGVITDIYLGNPHATLDVDAEGVVWRVELAPAGPTAASGFVEGVAKVGDNVTAIGHRSADETEPRMKAVRIIIGDNTYDVYPDRVKGI
jgi:hypothetical protein